LKHSHIIEEISFSSAATKRLAKKRKYETPKELNNSNASTIHDSELKQTESTIP